MAGKGLTALITVVIGIGAALLLFYALNKFAELLPAKWEERIKPLLYILPAFLAIVVYLVYPTILTFINAFKDRSSTEWVGFQNFEDLLTDTGFQDTIFNTLLWMIVVPISCVVLGLAVATLADRLGPRGEKTSKTVIFLPMAISMVGAATIWRFVYYAAPEGQPQIGLLNALRDGVGMSPVPWLQQSDWHFNSFLLMVVLLWSQVGFSMVLLSAAVKSVPEDTLEAARIDGADERSIFFRVVVPQIWGSVLTVYVTTLIGVMKIFDIVYVMTNGGFNTNVDGNEFFNQLFSNFNNGAAAAIVVMLMIATIPIMWYQVRNFRREELMA